MTSVSVAITPSRAREVLALIGQPGSSGATRGYDEHSAAEGWRVVLAAHVEGRRVRAWSRGHRVTIAVEGETHDGHAVTWYGRGESIGAAVEWLGAWEAF